MTFIRSLIIALGVLAPLAAQDPLNWCDVLDDALAEAQARDAKILVYVKDSV